jgi:hypothetical protein
MRNYLNRFGLHDCSCVGRKRHCDKGMCVFGCSVLGHLKLTTSEISAPHRRDEDDLQAGRMVILPIKYVTNRLIYLLAEGRING